MLVSNIEYFIDKFFVSASLIFFSHLGERLRVDLRKKDIPAPKLALLENRFDEAKNLGLLLPSATGIILIITY